MSGPLDTDMTLHIDHVKAPRGRLPESEGGELALVGVPPEYDLPEHATPTERDLEGPDPTPAGPPTKVSPATSVPKGKPEAAADQESAVEADEVTGRTRRRSGRS